MADIQKFEQSLDQMIQLMVQMKESLQEEEKPKQAEKPKPQSVKAQEKPKNNNELQLESFEQVKAALESDKWPEAVNPNLICDPTSEEDKMERGRGIIELMIEEDLKGLKFLDYGCGEGHTAFLATEYETAISVGYDPNPLARWEQFESKPNLKITTDFREVRSYAPYDVITVFDVIDHIKGHTPVELLTRVKGLLSDEGKIYLRCHPFTSRHATHLYHALNKAYLHLVFSPEELKQIVQDNTYTEENSGVIYPLRTYHQYLEEAGLVSVNRRDITEKVEPFFKIPKIADRIIKNTPFNEFPEFQMSLQFVDFVLKKK